MRKDFNFTNDEDRLKIAEKFKREKSRRTFPSALQQTEYEMCKAGRKELNVLVLLWGPLMKDLERMAPDFVIQCGLFATGKVLRRFRFHLPIWPKCRLSDPVFEENFVISFAVCNVGNLQEHPYFQISRPFWFPGQPCATKADYWTQIQHSSGAADSNAGTYRWSEEGKGRSDRGQGGHASVLPGSHGNLYWEWTWKCSGSQSCHETSYRQIQAASNSDTVLESAAEWARDYAVSANALLNDEGILVACKQISMAPSLPYGRGGWHERDQKLLRRLDDPPSGLLKWRALPDTGPWPISIAKEKRN